MAARRAAARYLETLRQSERTAPNLHARDRAFYGLLPPSISHEGYSAKPMHSYWDDFWALTGCEDATRSPRALGQREEARRLAAPRDEFRADLAASLARARGPRHRLSSRRGRARRLRRDLDDDRARPPAASCTGCPPTCVLGDLRALLARVRRRAATAASAWDDYTPYELRNVGAFVRLGWRERAHELLDFFMADRRPAAWNQWAEVVGRDPREPRFIGDMPHGWVASDFIRAVLDMFAYERERRRRARARAPAFPPAGSAGEGITVKGLRTPYGPLELLAATRRRARDAPGGRRPVPARRLRAAGRAPGPPARTRVNGSRPDGGQRAAISHVPATIVIGDRPWQPGTDDRVSRRLPLGQRHLRLSDRRLAARRRRRARASGSASRTRPA